MNLGIFGGSFDPVHLGHLALARACQEQAALDEIWFTPTAVQPLKRSGPQATDADRLVMLELAIAGETSWRICRLEIDRGGLSYTVDTLRQIHRELPAAAMYFLVGADAVREVPQWKAPAEIFRLATPLVVHRAGKQAPDLSELAQFCAAGHQPVSISMPSVAVSSTDIRRGAAAGDSLVDLVPPAVAQYIERHRLYR